MKPPIHTNLYIMEEINLEDLKQKLDKTLNEYFKSKNIQMAEQVLEQAIKVFDDHKYYQYLTIIKQKMKKMDENDLLLPQLCQKYNNPDDWNNYAIHLKDRKKFVESVVASQKAIKLNPNKAAYYCNQALSLTQLDKHQIAVKKIDQALLISPDEWFLNANKACCLADIGKYEESFPCFEKALANEQCNKEVEVDYFHALAFQKNYKEAWKRYESRYKCYQSLMDYMKKRNLERPEELKEDMELCVFMEQGSGDNLMFLRFLKEFQEKYKNSYFATSENFKEICNGLRVELEIKPTTKYGISILSLPYYLGSTEIPEPYRLGNYAYTGNIKKVGIVWAGNPAHPMDYQRSCYAEDFLSQIDFNKYKIYSFQKDNRPRKYVHSDEIIDFSKNLEKYKVIDLSNRLNSINDTVKCLEQMDYFISVDSLPIHIAGAVGIPSAVIVSDKPDWRWGKTGDYSEWYPNIRIYRKDKTQSLKSVIGSCLVDLEDISG
jgi:tetratricopeptide (TPR) repeat protein